jgi:hypothetical protein
LHPTKFIVGLGGTRVQVPFFIKAVNSIFMAWRHSGLLEAIVKQVGSMSQVLVSVTKALGGGLEIKPVGRALDL